MVRVRVRGRVKVRVRAALGAAAKAALGELDRHTAQKLALKREVERVQERMDGVP